MKKNILLVATGSVALEKFKHTYKLLSAFFNIKIIASKYALENFEFSSDIKIEIEETKLNTFPLHITHAKWADQIVVIPATANTIAKFHQGIADSQILSTLIAARQPIIFVPAMNTHMYSSLIERNIITELSNMGHIFIGPCVGMLKEKEVGMGRMIEPEDIAKTITNFMIPKQAKKILISAGASKIYIDPIRYITNGATGNFAQLISNELRLLGHHVEILNISSYTNQEVINIIRKAKIDIYISTAAFADFDVLKYSNSKIKKGSISNIELKNNIDVLKELSSDDLEIYGFKLDDDKNNAIKKMIDLDLKGILWNKLYAINSNNITGAIILKNKELEFVHETKENVAKFFAKEI